MLKRLVSGAYRVTLVFGTLTFVVMLPPDESSQLAGEQECEG